MKFDPKKGATIELAMYNVICEGGYTFLAVYDYNPEERPSNRVRISEPVAVQFIPRTTEVVLTEAVKVLDQRIQDIRAESGLKIRQIEEQKSKLLSLTYQGTP